VAFEDLQFSAVESFHCFFEYAFQVESTLTCWTKSGDTHPHEECSCCLDQAAVIHIWLFFISAPFYYKPVSGSSSVIAAYDISCALI